MLYIRMYRENFYLREMGDSKLLQVSIGHSWIIIVTVTTLVHNHKY